ncbi:MAG: hypothetical protein ABJE66_37870, partial [Deltaproteobacteria bacterium]
MVKVLAFSILVAAACTTSHPDEAAVCGDGVTTPGVNGTGEICGTRSRGGLRSGDQGRSLA